MKSVVGILLVSSIAQASPWHRLQSIFKLPTSLSGSEADLNPIPTTSMTDVTTAFLSNGQEDPSLTDEVHVNMQRLLSGDVHGVISDAINHPDQLELFGHPEAAWNMLQVFPMLKAFPAVQELSAKSQDEFTSEDGLTMLIAIQNFTAKAIENLEATSDQAGFVDMMNKYYELGTTDPEWAALWQKVEAGDKQATMELHDKTFDDLWGNVVDKEAMGYNGVEPEQTVQLRENIINNVPELWSLITGDDPMTQKFIAEPLSALEIAAALSQLELNAADDLGSVARARD